MAYRAGTAFIQIAPSFKGFQLKISAEAKKLRAIDVPVNLKVDAGQARAEIDAVTRGRDSTINVNADTGKARTELDLLARDRRANVDVNVRGQKGINFAFRGVSNLTTAIVGLAPLAVPALAAVTAGVGTLGAALITAGAAGGLFGAAVIGQVTRMKTQQTAMKSLNKSLASTKASQEQYRIALDATKKGTTAHTTALHAYESAQNRTTAAQDRLTRAQKNFNQTFGPAAKGFHTLKAAWSDFLGGTRRETVGAIGDALTLVAHLLPRLVPLANAAGSSIRTLISQFKDFTGTHRFQSILNFFMRQGPNAILSFGHIAGNVILGIINLFRAFAPYQQSLLHSFQDMTASFVTWSAGFGKSNGFQRFMDYAKRTLPLVRNFLGQLIEFVGKFIVALGPLAGIELKIVTQFLRGLNTLPPKVLTGIAFGITAIVLGLKAWELGTKGVVIVTRVWAAAQWLLNAALDANPIGLVVIGLAALGVGLVIAYKKSATFRKIVAGALLYVQIIAASVTRWFTKSFVPFFTKTIPNAFRATLNWVKRNWPVILAIITGPIGLATLFIVRHWNTITNAFKDAKNWVVGAWSGAWAVVELRILKPLQNARDAIGHMFGPNGPIRSAFSAAIGAIGRIWAGLKRAAAVPVNFVIGTVYNNGIRKALNLLPGVNLGAAHLVKFATGGSVSGGTPGRDSVPAMLMPGEHVWTAREVAKVGGQRAMYAMREAVQRFGDGGQVLDRARSSLLHWGNAASFARSQVGKPYVWGGVGPGGYDCSGFMSAITNVLRGMNPHQRVGSTASFPWAGFVHGPGEFTIGSTNRYPGSSVGHMAGTLQGMNVESRGGTGVIVGPGARGYRDPGFSKIYHIGAGGNFGGGSGGGLSNPLKTLNVAAWVKRLTHMGGFGPTLAAIPGHLVSSLAGFVKNQIKKAIGVIGDAVGAVGHGFNTLGSGSVQDQVRALAAIRGWGGGAEWAALSQIISHESGWNPNAANPSSSARGLFQKLTSAHGPIESTVAGQAKWGLTYIGNRYGDPLNAWRFWQAHHSYDSGGYLPPGLSTVYNGTGKPEPVLTTRQFSDIRSLADSGGKAGWTANYGDVYTYDIDEFRRKQRADMRKLELMASLPT